MPQNIYNFWDLIINIKTPFGFILAMLYAIIGTFSLFRPILEYENHKHTSAFVALGSRPFEATPNFFKRICARKLQLAYGYERRKVV